MQLRHSSRNKKIQVFVIVVYFALFEHWTVNKKLPPTHHSPPPTFPNWRLQIECVLLKLHLVHSCMCTYNGPAGQDCALHWERKQLVNDQFQLLRLSRIPLVAIATSQLYVHARLHLSWSTFSIKVITYLSHFMQSQTGIIWKTTL